MRIRRPGRRIQRPDERPNDQLGERPNEQPDQSGGEAREPNRQSSQQRRGRHRRQRSAKRQPSLPSVAIAALAAVGLFALAAAEYPKADTSQLAVPDAELGDGLPPLDESDDASLEPFLDPQHLEMVPVGPEDVAEPVQVVLSGAEVIETLGESGIPDVALRAYKQSEARLATNDSSCRLRWTLLAAIGRVESNHGRFGGARLREDGYATKRIRGIPLDGRPNVALIRDTDGGTLDGDTTYDRAVGPMQFIPSTWRSVRVDGNGDGRRDPNNIYDAAEGAGVYLCAGDTNMDDLAQRAHAIRRYNNADSYVRVVLNLERQYATGHVMALPSDAEPAPADRPTSDSGSEQTARPSSPKPSAAPSAAATTSPPKATPTPPGTPTPTPSPDDTASESASPPEEPARAEPSTPDEPEETVDPPDESVPADTSPSPETPTESSSPPEPHDTATVGWAPAMREAVVKVLEEEQQEEQRTESPESDSAACPDGAESEAATGSESTEANEDSTKCSPTESPQASVLPTTESTPDG
jgi:Transglycosylase SLT domain